VCAPTPTSRSRAGVLDKRWIGSPSSADDGRNITGVIVRIYQRTANLGTGDGETWRVPFNVLRHVLDV